jgi:hypothetical protein
MYFMKYERSEITPLLPDWLLGLFQRFVSRGGSEGVPLLPRRGKAKTD